MSYIFSTEQSYQSTAKPKLKGGDIHTVLFKGAKFEVVEGKQDKNKGIKYNTLQFSFENEVGYYTHVIFDPGDDGNTRREFDWNGTKIMSPSPSEETQIVVGQILNVLNPDGLKQLAGKEISGFEKLSKAVEKLLSTAVDSEVQLKLMLGKDGNARLPIVAALNRNGELYPSSNFIGKEGLFFTDKEKTQLEKIQTATPTSASSLIASEPAPIASSDDLDLDLV